MHCTVKETLEHRLRNSPSFIYELACVLENPKLICIFFPYPILQIIFSSSQEIILSVSPDIYALLLKGGFQTFIDSLWGSSET